MPFPNPDTQFKPGKSGNPSGVPKGTKHISTYIRAALEDEKFEFYKQDPREGYKKYKMMPVKAITTVAIEKAVAGDDKAREWLAKYGYGQKLELEHSGEIDTGIQDPATAAAFMNFLKQNKS